MHCLDLAYLDSLVLQEAQDLPLQVALNPEPGVKTRPELAVILDPSTHLALEASPEKHRIRERFWEAARKAGQVP